MKFYPYNSKWGTVEQIGFAQGTYYDGNRALLAYVKHVDDHGWVEAYADVSVNIEFLADSYRIAIDTNNLGDEMVDFLVENGFAEETGRVLHSGYCNYPVLEFDEEWLDGLEDVNEIPY